MSRNSRLSLRENGIGDCHAARTRPTAAAGPAGPRARQRL